MAAVEDELSPEEMELEFAAAALRQAAMDGDAGRVRRLLAAHGGASIIDRRDALGNTALVMAAHYGKLAVCELLLTAGAEPFARNLGGYAADIFDQDADRGDQKAARALYAAFCAGGGERPERYRLRLEAPDEWVERVKRSYTPSGQNYFEFFLSATLLEAGVADTPTPLNWTLSAYGERKIQTGEGNVWLLSGEAEALGKALAAMRESALLSAATLEAAPL